MKQVKMLGLAVVAAVAAMAVAGVAGAAAQWPVLCKAANETPCSEGQTYKIPLNVRWERQVATQVQFNAKSSSLISCQRSGLSGEIYGLSATQQIGKITTATWGECTGSLGESCTATALQLPWAMHLGQKGNNEQNNGDMYIGEKEGGGQPGAVIKCKTILGTIECEYKSKEIQPEHTGEWMMMQFFGGGISTLVANEVQLKKVRGGSVCGGEGLWNAEYVLWEPSPEVYLTHQEP